MKTASQSFKSVQDMRWSRHRGYRGKSSKWARRRSKEAMKHYLEFKEFTGKPIRNDPNIVSIIKKATIK